MQPTGSQASSAKLNIRPSPHSADQKVHPPPPAKACPEIPPRHLFPPPSCSSQHHTNNAKPLPLRNQQDTLATASLTRAPRNNPPIFLSIAPSTWHFVPRAPIQDQDGCVPRVHIQLHYLPPLPTTTGQRALPLSPLSLHLSLHSQS